MRQAGAVAPWRRARWSVLVKGTVSQHLRANRWQPGVAVSAWHRVAASAMVSKICSWRNAGFWYGFFGVADVAGVAFGLSATGESIRFTLDCRSARVDGQGPTLLRGPSVLVLSVPVLSETNPRFLGPAGRAHLAIDKTMLDTPLGKALEYETALK